MPPLPGPRARTLCLALLVQRGYAIPSARIAGDRLKRRRIIVLAIGLLGTPIAQGATLDVRALAAGCASCHQRGQQSPPALTGQSAKTLAAKLFGFRDGTRNGTVMPRIGRGYSRAELEALARYFAARGSAQ